MALSNSLGLVLVKEVVNALVLLTRDPREKKSQVHFFGRHKEKKREQKKKGTKEATRR